MAEISASCLNQLFEIAIERQLLTGDIILRQRQVCKKIVFVEKGYLRTFMDKDGRDINTDFTFEGDFTINLKGLRYSLLMIQQYRQANQRIFMN